MGKDNIVFHTVIWPSMLLGYGEGGAFGAGRGALELPDNVASSEFLTMEGKKFSSSRGVADPRPRLPEPVRPGRAALLPHDRRVPRRRTPTSRGRSSSAATTTSSSRRWGNLVNRTLQSAYKNFGAVPTPGDAHEPRTRRCSRRSRRDSTSVGSLIEAARFRSALQEAMRLAALGNQYVARAGAVGEAGRPIASAPRRSSTSRCARSTASRSSSRRSCRSPRSGSTRCSATTDVIAGPLAFESVDEAEAPSTSCSPATTRSWVGRWEPSALPAGQELREPRAALREARRRSTSSRRSSRGWRPRSGVTDSHAHLDACDEPAAIARRAGARAPA